MRFLPLAKMSWQFRDATTRSAWRGAVVPGCVHRDLLRHKLIPDPFWSSNEAQLQWIEERDWEYRSTFTVPAILLQEETVDLVAEGLDTIATVYVNGREVARTENMFTGYRWNVKALLRQGRNELRIFFSSATNYARCNRLEHQPREINDPVGRCVVVRKEQCQFGWDWGPRFVTAGIWRDICLEGWSENRLENVRITQEHVVGARPPSAGLGKKRPGAAALPPEGESVVTRVVLHLTPELQRADGTATVHWRLFLRDDVVGEGTGSMVEIEEPQLWWPNGQGAQPLYRLEVEVRAADNASIGHWERRIGLRTIALDRHADQWGETFQFVVNGRPIFAKGANWIPVHTFVAGLTRADYERDLVSAATAHMNMIRVWGGGIYESEDFYDVCDERGLLVWQDFMFACTLYPADRPFLESARLEAEYQARRLRHRASLALWCGNNEVFGCNVQELIGDKKKLTQYETLFHQVLPSALRSMDTVTPYWPGSPWRGDVAADHVAGEQRGDTHFWDVWHARQPVKDYEKYVFRFVSEFGMQSFSSPETNAMFCPPHDDNVFGPEMENHQKNRFGNQVILDYVSRWYRFPKGQDALIYLSQLNQAYCMQVGVEHWRRNRPRCMGALYWQLNDCWPVASWSSIEFTGRWRALHHVARRFFAPALVSAQLVGDETTIIGNYRRNTVQAVKLYTIYDAPAPAKGFVRWDVFHLDGDVVQNGRKAVALHHGQSVHQHTVDLAKVLTRYARESIYLRIALEISGERVSEETVFLVAPRFLDLPKAKTGVTIKLMSPRYAVIRFKSNAFQHRFAFDFPGLVYQSSDNYFELYPRETKIVWVEFFRPQTVAKLKRRLTSRSLFDTY